jgi:hypothetical protein
VLGWLARLGATVPFAEVAALLAELTGIRVSAATVRRQTEALGATVVTLAEAEVARLEQEWPLPPVAPERLVVSVDGAMVPLRGGEWAEMKLVSVGEPEPESRAGEGPLAAGVRLRQLSYFARVSDAETFGRQALGELHRRGLERARAVAAVQDGAVWLQGFMDFHRPDALRILDWPHAAQRLTAIAEPLFGVGTAAQSARGRAAAALAVDGRPPPGAGRPGLLGAPPARRGRGRGLPARAAGPARLSGLSPAGVAGRQWTGRERPQTRDAGADEAGGDALGARAGQRAAGAAPARPQWAMGQ